MSVDTHDPFGINAALHLCGPVKRGKFMALLDGLRQDPNTPPPDDSLWPLHTAIRAGVLAVKDPSELIDRIAAAVNATVNEANTSVRFLINAESTFEQLRARNALIIKLPRVEGIDNQKLSNYLFVTFTNQLRVNEKLNANSTISRLQIKHNGILPTDSDELIECYELFIIVDENNYKMEMQVPPDLMRAICS